MSDLTVLALSGSLRCDSLNTRLLREAERLAAPGVRFGYFGEVGRIPLFRQQRAQVRIDASLQCAYVDPRTGSVLASCSAGVVALALGRAPQTGQAAPPTEGNE